MTLKHLMIAGLIALPATQVLAQAANPAAEVAQALGLTAAQQTIVDDFKKSLEGEMNDATCLTALTDAIGENSELATEFEQAISGCNLPQEQIDLAVANGLAKAASAAAGGPAPGAGTGTGTSTFSPVVTSNTSGGGGGGTASGG
jgi:hypothetical protein